MPQNQEKPTPPKSKSPATSSTPEPAKPTLQALLSQAVEILKASTTPDPETPPTEDTLLQELEQALLRAGKRSKPPTVADSMMVMADKLRDVNGMFEDLIDLTINDPEFVPPEVRVSKDDIVIVYSVQMITGAKSIMHLKGRQDLPMALHPSQVHTALRKFQTVFAAVIGEPLCGRLQHHLTSIAMPDTQNTFFPPEDDQLSLPDSHSEDDDTNGGFIAPSIDD